jgi:hypothetical protein
MNIEEHASDGWMYLIITRSVGSRDQISQVGPIDTLEETRDAIREDVDNLWFDPENPETDAQVDERIPVCEEIANMRGYDYIDLWDDNTQVETRFWILPQGTYTRTGD